MCHWNQSKPEVGLIKIRQETTVTRLLSERFSHLLLTVIFELAKYPVKVRAEAGEATDTCIYTCTRANHKIIKRKTHNRLPHSIPVMIYLLDSIHFGPFFPAGSNCSHFSLHWGPNYLADVVWSCFYVSWAGMLMWDANCVIGLPGDSWGDTSEICQQRCSFRGLGMVEMNHNKW